MSEESTSASHLKGIGGWLILPAIGLIAGPIRLAFQFWRDMLPALKPETWHALTTPGSEAYHRLWGPLIIFEVITNVAMFAFTLWLLVLFFRKSRRVPKLAVAWLVLLAAVPILDQMLANQIPLVAAQADPESLRDIARALVGAVIWVPYFLKSKRVKNTFIEGSPGAPSGPDMARPSLG